LIIVLLIVLLLFGATKLPKLAKSFGEASKEFKKGVASDDPAPEERVTLTRAELDSLRSARDSQAARPPPETDVPPAV